MRDQYVMLALLSIMVASAPMLAIDKSYGQTSDGGAPSFRFVSLVVDGESYIVMYHITGETTLQSATVDKEARSVNLYLDPSGSLGEFQIELPRNVIDSKDENNNDIDYVVLVDGRPANVETHNRENTRILSILFDGGSRQITITGTHVIPEFPYHIVLIISAAIGTIIAIGRAGLLSRFYGTGN